MIVYEQRHLKRLTKASLCEVLLAILVVSLATLLLLPTRSDAQSNAEDFNPGYIMSDSVMSDSSSMSEPQVQAWLSANGNCDNTNLQWLTSTNNPTDPNAATQGTLISNGVTYLYYLNDGHFVCMADQLFNGQTAAQIIYAAAQTYGINPEVLIVLLQKEQGLVTDSWPNYNHQYAEATGYMCPDTPSGCDGSYAGFANQVNNAAALFHSVLTGGWSDYPLGVNYIQYNPSASCGGGQVTIQSLATSALYRYTPYQPDAAALAAGYGDGDSCSSYGNRNFYLYFTDWFGSTTVDPFAWEVDTISGGNGQYFLVVGNTKRWIPNEQIYSDWGLNKYPVNQVAASYLNSIPTIPDLGRLGYDASGNYVFVDSGQKYILPYPTSTSNWGLSSQLATAAPVYTLLASIPTSGNAGPFVKESGANDYFLMSNGILYPIAASYVTRWNINNPTTLASTTLSMFTQSSLLDYRVSVGGVNYFVDDGRLLNVTNCSDIYGTIANPDNFVSINSSSLPYFSVNIANPLVEPTGSNSWYYLLDGNQYYVPSSATARAWGSSSSPQIISQALLSELPSGGNLSTQVYATDTKQYYILDGSKHLVQTSVVPDWIGGTPPVNVVSSNLEMPSGAALSSPIFQVSGTPDDYTVINGTYYHFPTFAALYSYGFPVKYNLATIGGTALSTMDFIGNVSQYLLSGGITYYLQNGTAYPLTPSSTPSWTEGLPVPSYSGSDFNTRFSPQATPLTNFISDSSGNFWLVDNGQKISLGQYAQAYSPSWSPINVLSLTTSKNAGFLVRSSTLSDSRVWLINQGTKQWIPNTPLYNGFGGSKLPITYISSETLDTIPTTPTTSASPSLIIYSGSSGLKFLVDGQYYAFPDSSTVTNVVGSNGVTSVSPAIYSSFSQQAGTITRLIEDPSTGMIYYMVNGQKDWITNAAAYGRYQNIGLTVLPPDVINWFPTGANIN